MNRTRAPVLEKSAIKASETAFNSTEIQKDKAGKNKSANIDTEMKEST